MTQGFKGGVLENVTSDCCVGVKQQLLRCLQMFVYMPVSQPPILTVLDKISAYDINIVQ